MSYLKLKNDKATLLKTTTKDDEYKDIKNETERHPHENNLYQLETDNHHYKKKYKSRND